MAVSGFTVVVGAFAESSSSSGVNGDPGNDDSPFSATVDNNLAAQLTSRLFAFEAPTSVVLAGGQALLCLDLGSGEIFAGSCLAPSSSVGGIDNYSLPVPHDPSLVGFSFCSQAIQFGSPPFVLSNAQDLTVGGF